MALPTLAKTWEISSNNVVSVKADYAACQRNIMLTIVNYFKSVGWTKRAASNATTASISNDWSTATDINYNGYMSNRSWIILRNASLGSNSNYDILIDLGGAYQSGGGSNLNASSFIGELTVFVSPGGYNLAGTLSTTSRPPTNDNDESEITGFNPGYNMGYLFGSNTNVSFVWHGWSSSDREVTRMAFYLNDNIVGYISFEKANQPIAGWTVPVLSTWISNNNGTGLTMTNFYSAGWVKTRINGVNVPIYLSGEGYTTGLLTNALTVPNDVSGEYPLIPMGIVSTTVPVRGRHGGLSDIWYSIGSVSNGSTLADSNGTPRKFIFNSGVVLPWNGSIPVIR